jgi:hypothetical protein
MSRDKCVFFFKKKPKYAYNPYKLKKLLETEPRNSGFFQFSIPAYDDLGNEWHHPNWTGTYNAILDEIKAGMNYQKVKNRENEYFVALPLSDVEKKIRVYFETPENAPSGTGPFLIYQIKIVNYDI